MLARLQHELQAGLRVWNQQGDERRQRLYADERMTALQELVEIDLLQASGKAELGAWQSIIAGLKTCREFHEGILTDSPTCRCGFRPATSVDIEKAEQVLDHLDLTLDDLLSRWRQALLDALSSEAVQTSLGAMTEAERMPVSQFLSQSDTQTEIPQGFVRSAIQALRGIQSLTLPVDALLEALKAGGLPCTPAELERRFAAFVKQEMRGYDAQTTRLSLDR